MIKSTFLAEKSQHYEMSLDPTNLHYFENNTVLVVLFIEKSISYRYYQSAKTILSSNFHHVGVKQLDALNNSGLIIFLGAIIRTIVIHLRQNYLGGEYLHVKLRV